VPIEWPSAAAAALTDAEEECSKVGVAEIASRCEVFGERRSVDQRQQRIEVLQEEGYEVRDVGPTGNVLELRFPPDRVDEVRECSWTGR
jgi:hypothetical protein